jgi:hypothetical protein
MEDELNIFENGRQPIICLKEDNLIFLKRRPQRKKCKERKTTYISNATKNNRK